MKERRMRMTIVQGKMNEMIKKLMTVIKDRHWRFAKPSLVRIQHYPLWQNFAMFLNFSAILVT